MPSGSPANPQGPEHCVKRCIQSDAACVGRGTDIGRQVSLAISLSPPPPSAPSLSVSISLCPSLRVSLVSCCLSRSFSLSRARTRSLFHSRRTFPLGIAGRVAFACLVRGPPCSDVMLYENAVGVISAAHHRVALVHSPVLLILPPRGTSHQHQPWPQKHIALLKNRQVPMPYPHTQPPLPMVCMCQWSESAATGCSRASSSRERVPGQGSGLCAGSRRCCANSNCNESGAKIDLRDLIRARLVVEYVWSVVVDVVPLQPLLPVLDLVVGDDNGRRMRF